MTFAFLPIAMAGAGEVAILCLILILIFGAKKIPQLARSLGASLTEFKKGRAEGANDNEEKPSEG